MGFVAGLIVPYVLVAVALLVRDGLIRGRVRKLREYPRWPGVLFERWPRRRKTPKRLREWAQGQQ